MTKIEKKFLESCDKNITSLVIIFFIILGVAVRIPLRHYVSGDYQLYLFPWYNEILDNGLSRRVGDYNFLYQFLILFMTRTNIYPLYAYKILSCAFDFLLATVAGIIAGTLTEKKEKWNGVLVFGLVLLSPIVVLNSSAWAQCDAIYVTFILLSLLLLDKKCYWGAFIFLGISFAFKLQAVFILPLFLFIYYVEKRFSIIQFLIVPSTMVIISLPIIFWGRKLIEVFEIYLDQAKQYKAMSMNYPSVWQLLCKARDSFQYTNLWKFAIITTVFVLAYLMIWWIRKSYSPSGKNMIIMAFLLVYTCVLFLPQMHERYGYLYEILSLILVVSIPKTFFLCVGLSAITLISYGIYLFGIDANCLLLSCINLTIYCAYIWVLKDEFVPIKSVV